MRVLLQQGKENHACCRESVVRDLDSVVSPFIIFSVPRVVDMGCKSTFQINPVPELVSWSRKRITSTTRASICPAVSMIGMSGSARVFNNK